jgi:hypothetical protein
MEPRNAQPIAGSDTTAPQPEPELRQPTGPNVPPVTDAERDMINRYFASLNIPMDATMNTASVSTRRRDTPMDIDFDGQAVDLEKRMRIQNLILKQLWENAKKAPPKWKNRVLKGPPAPLPEIVVGSVPRSNVRTQIVIDNGSFENYQGHPNTPSFHRSRVF